MTTATALDVTLKNLKTYPKLSEETLAFSASVYIDGKKVGEASNRGHGEPVLVHWFENETRKNFEAWLDTLPPERYCGHCFSERIEDVGDSVICANCAKVLEGENLRTMTLNEDNFFSGLVVKEDEKKRLKTLNSKATLFRLKGDAKGEYRYVTRGKKKAKGQDAVDWIKANYTNIEEILP
jgi:hypothetical protein